MLSAGAGCTGGGPQVECLLPQSRFGSNCNHLFCTVPARVVELRFELGDGDDAFSATSMTREAAGEGALITLVDTGAGVDVVDGSEATDRIDPGPGADVVRSAAGNDAVQASPGDADGADLIDLGEGLDTASYEFASASVALTSNAVADDGIAGDGDNLISAEHLIGGPADDVLTGTDQPTPANYVHDIGLENEILEGNGGSDLLDGRGGPDELIGGSSLVFFDDRAPTR